MLMLQLVKLNMMSWHSFKHFAACIDADVRVVSGDIMRKQGTYSVQYALCGCALLLPRGKYRWSVAPL